MFVRARFLPCRNARQIDKALASEGHAFEFDVLLTLPRLVKNAMPRSSVHRVAARSNKVQARRAHVHSGTLHVPNILRLILFSTCKLQMFYQKC
jgi:hypothetical protein